MELAKSDYPSLPPNYVTILELKERWIKEQQRLQKEIDDEQQRLQKEKEEEQQRESQRLPEDKRPIQNETPSKFRGRSHFRPNGDKDRRMVEGSSQKQKSTVEGITQNTGWLKEAEKNRPKFKVRCQEPEDSVVKTDRRTVQAEYHPEEAEVGGKRPGSLKAKKDRRTVHAEYHPDGTEVRCQKPDSLKVEKGRRTADDWYRKPEKPEQSEVQGRVGVGEEIKEDEQKTDGLKKKKRWKRRRKPKAEEELAGHTVQPESKNGNEEKSSSRVDQMDGIGRRMENLSVNPGKVGGNYGSTSIEMNDHSRKPAVSGSSGRRKATGAGFIWVRKEETAYDPITSRNQECVSWKKSHTMNCKFPCNLVEYGSESAILPSQ